ncbi:hypothetical protein Vafri_7535 [Volvox africanus]|uniref:Tyrosine specific protein phosphatases domain-containing protein n=1 Tax=Volvox africanus TaxID=51714 RepID=A0A8J4EXU9_9CHLO|nr:hypothetical protein Vafri_7535 [Volvox africanus]
MCAQTAGTECSSPLLSPTGVYRPSEPFFDPPPDDDDAYRGGVGRAGMMAACVLVRLGVRIGPAEAIAAVRQHRRGAVESMRQEAFVAAYCRSFECQSRTTNASSDATAQAPLAVMTLPNGACASNVNSGTLGNMVPGGGEGEGEG